MQQRHPDPQAFSPSWTAALQRLGAWVLDQPLPPSLEGQCCDRLRPAQIGRDLERALARHGLGHCTVVEWRWDQRRGRAKGWLWSNGLLQRFHWQRHSDDLALRHQLMCQPRGPLQAVRPVG